MGDITKIIYFIIDMNSYCIKEDIKFDCGFEEENLSMCFSKGNKFVKHYITPKEIILCNIDLAYSLFYKIKKGLE